VEEATTAGRRPSRFDRLGIWIALPLLALALMGFLFLALPEGACDESADGDAGAWVIFVWGAAVCAACLTGAIQRLLRLIRAGVPRRQAVFALLTVGVLAALAAVLRIGDEAGLYWHAWVVAVPATGLALLALIVAALRRRRPDDVGLLLPAYLAGAGLFVFPSLALITALVKSDALCS
jgi:peptidoglycan/LPS O-acetylase OafA/YrhL